MAGQYLRLRKDLTGPVSPLNLNDNYLFRLFCAATDLSAARNVLNESYQNGEGNIQGADEWWSSVSNDEEYTPDLMFCVTDRADNVVGFAHSWSSGFLKDLAVLFEHRNSGLGRYLLNETFLRCRKFGLATLDLKVMADNQSGAIELYRSMGMAEVIETKGN